jgi:hypothetical protein
MCFSFIFTYWLQRFDNNYKNKTNFDKFKLSIVVACLIGIFMLQNIKNTSNFNYEILTEVPNF